MMNHLPRNSRHIMQQTLAGRVPPFPAVGPLAVHYCARLAGVSVREYTTDARVLADCVIRYYETFRPDAVWLSADTWVTAEAMGAPVAFPSDDQPLGGTGEPLVRTRADIDRIPPPDPTRQGRWPLMLDALQRVVRALKHRAYVVACFDQYPFSLACALMGIERVMTGLDDDREILEALMDRCTDYATAYAEALARAGADVLSGGDSPAGLIGRNWYRQIALPAQRRLIGRIKAATSLPVSLHICGDATPILPDMATTGADVLELDHRVDMRRACELLGPDIVIWGNLDPVRLLAHATAEHVQRVCQELIDTVRTSGHPRFVLSSGCTLAVETPHENLQAMIRVASEGETA